MLQKTHYDLMCKFLIIGSSQVGKTNLLTRFSDDLYTETHITTIGVDFKCKEIKVNGKMMKMQIWDTAGQERFKTLTQNYYKGAHGVLLVYSIEDSKSFEDITSWINSLKQHGKPEIQIILVANKVDLENRLITQEQGINLASKLNIEYFETSAKTNYNVKEVFERIADLVEQQITQKVSLTSAEETQNLKLNSEEGEKKRKKKTKKQECC